MTVTRNTSGEEIVNVNFFYDDIVHVLQNTKTENLLRLAN